MLDFQKELKRDDLLQLDYLIKTLVFLSLVISFVHSYFHLCQSHILCLILAYLLLYSQLFLLSRIKWGLREIQSLDFTMVLIYLMELIDRLCWLIDHPILQVLICQLFLHHHHIVFISQNVHNYAFQYFLVISWKIELYYLRMD